MLIRGVVKFYARDCPGINFRKVGNYAIPQPQNISLLLQESGNFDRSLTGASLACNGCYAFLQENIRGL